MDKVFQNLKEKEITLSIYTDLDTLFDTRLPIAAGLDTIGTMDAVTSGKYANRTTEQIADIPENVFKMFYAERNRTHFAQSMPTYVYNLVAEEYYETVVSSKTIALNPTKLYINAYPFLLENEELESIKSIFNNPIITFDIEFIWVPPEKLLPTWLANNVSSVYMYSFLEWLELQAYLDNINTTVISYITAYFPILHRANVQHTPDIPNSLLEHISTIVQARPLHTRTFCASSFDKDRDTILDKFREEPVDKPEEKTDES